MTMGLHLESFSLRHKSGQGFYRRSAVVHVCQPSLSMPLMLSKRKHSPILGISNVTTWFYSQVNWDNVLKNRNQTHNFMIVDCYYSCRRGQNIAIILLFILTGVQLLCLTICLIKDIMKFFGKPKPWNRISDIIKFFKFLVFTLTILNFRMNVETQRKSFIIFGANSR